MAEGNAAMPSEGTSSQTVTQEESPSTTSQEGEVVHLRLTEPGPSERRGVQWGEDVVDNEGMGKKSSKCCCVYKKPKKWDESDSDESDEEGETDRCRGHVEKQKRNQPDKNCDCH